MTEAHGFFDYEKIREAARSADPFRHIVVDDILHKDKYALLYETFPDLDLFDEETGYKTGHGKFVLTRNLRYPRSRANFDAFTKRNRLWKDFYREMHSRKFVQEMLDLFGIRKLYVNNHLLNEAVLKRFHPFVFVNFQFSVLKRGAFLEPHTDIPSKIVALVLYFKDKNWREDWGGGTSLLTKVPDGKGYRFDKSKECGFHGNRALIFARTPHSWHKVETIKCPNESVRKSISINLYSTATGLLEKIRRLVGKKRSSPRMDLAEGWKA